jgi:glutamyl-tRNA(Gln) amidotransferase subunit D
MYRGRAKAFLGDIKVGDRVRVKRGGRVIEGIVMPRSELGDEEHIVVKLDNGYNMGFLIDDIEIELLSRGEKKEAAREESRLGEASEKPVVTILGTGGTIASKIDYSTGAVHPAFSVAELTRAIPELTQLANIKTKLLFNILSENMTPEHWRVIARECAAQLNHGAAGVVIAHGTDTLAYTSAALSFMLKNLCKPVVLVGSQRSSDRPSSDSAMNLLAAVKTATSDLGEVVVVMHASPEDTYCLIHRGTRVRKMHSSRRDAFRSINALPLGRVAEKVEFYGEHRKRGKGRVKVDDKLEERVALVKMYPGFDAELMAYYINNYKGIVIEGTGLGHTPTKLIEEIKRGCDSGVPIVMTTQTLYGRVDMKVYSTGRKLLAAGVIPGGYMLPEVALVKLMYALGHTQKPEEVRKIMLTNLAGELSETSSVDAFLR